MSQHDTRPAGGFPTTHWTRVVRAGNVAHSQSGAALAELCAGYWYPIYAFIRWKGHGADDAFDLTQAFFTRLIEKGSIAAADPAKGRFRSFLLADCTFFLSDEGDRARALKRGEGITPVPLDAEAAETRFRHEPAHVETPERLFERAWALSLIDQAMIQVAQHYTETRRGELFERLRPVLTAEPNAVPYAQIAQERGMTAGAVQVAVHRLRARFGSALRALVAGTLEDPSSEAVDEEIRSLFSALAR